MRQVPIAVLKLIPGPGGEGSVDRTGFAYRPEGEWQRWSNNLRTAPSFGRKLTTAGNQVSARDEIGGHLKTRGFVKRADKHVGTFNGSGPKAGDAAAVTPKGGFLALRRPDLHHTKR